MQNHPPVEKPLVELEVGAAYSWIWDNGANTSFTWSIKNHEQEIVEQKVLVFNLQNKSHSDFVSLDKPDTSFRPVGIEFNKNENALYITSIGKVEIWTTCLMIIV
jgi:hypothetical protein